MLTTPNMRGTEIYPLCMIRHGDDKQLRSFHILHCLHKECCERLVLSTGGRGRLSVNAIVKFASNKGWLADKRGYVLCIRHNPSGKTRARPGMKPAARRAAFAKIRETDIARAATKMKENPPVPEVAGASVTLAEPPKIATREDKRRIKDFLDEKYDDTRGCWILDWSDLKASQSLKVPRAWITAVREDFYGPDISERSQQENQQIKLLLEEAVKLKNDALALATRAESLENSARKVIL